MAELRLPSFECHCEMRRRGLTSLRKSFLPAAIASLAASEGRKGTWGASAGKEAALLTRAESSPCQSVVSRESVEGMPELPVRQRLRRWRPESSLRLRFGFG